MKFLQTVALLCAIAFSLGASAGGGGNQDSSDTGGPNSDYNCSPNCTAPTPPPEWKLYNTESKYSSYCKAYTVKYYYYDSNSDNVRQSGETTASCTYGTYCGTGCPYD